MKTSIVYIIPSLYSGAGTVNVMYSLIKSIDYSQFDVHIVFYKDYDEDKTIDLTDYPVKLFRIQKPGLLNIINVRKQLNEYLGEIESSNRIVHYFDLLLIVPLNQVFRRNGFTKRIAHTLSSVFSENFLHHIRNFFLAYPIRFLVTDLWSCSEESAQMWFGKRNGFKVVIINESIDVRGFSIDNKYREEIRSELNCDDKILLGHIGRLNDNKNQMFLLDVIHQLNEKSDDYKLLLIGDGQSRLDILKKIQKLNLNDSVLLLESQNDIYRYYSAFDIFCFPSLTEGFGLVALESQASGLYTLISNTIPDAVYVTDLAIKLEYNNLMQWIRTIKELPKDYDFARRRKYNEVLLDSKYDDTSKINFIMKMYLMGND